MIFADPFDFTGGGGGGGSFGGGVGGGDPYSMIRIGENGLPTIDSPYMIYRDAALAAADKWATSHQYSKLTSQDMPHFATSTPTPTPKPSGIATTNETAKLVMLGVVAAIIAAILLE